MLAQLALLPDDETLLRVYGNSKLSTLANFYGENAEVTFEGVTNSSLSTINKEELVREWLVFPKEEGYVGGKNPALIFERH